MHKTKWLTYTRWLARTWGLLSIGFTLLIFIGETFSATTPSAPTGVEWLMLLFFPVGVLVGLVLSWRWELLGGLLTAVSIAAFYLTEFLATGNWAGGPWFLLVAFPGFLFLLLGIVTRDERQHKLA